MTRHARYCITNLTCFVVSRLKLLQCSLNLPVFILSAAIICMQVEVCLAKAMRLKEVVEQADNTVASLTNVHPSSSPSYEKLLLWNFVSINAHLTGDSLAIDAKQPTLPGRQEIHGSWLHRMVRDVDLCVMQVFTL